MKVKNILIGTLLMLLFATQPLFAQDDLLNMINETPKEPTKVYATFKSTRVVNLHSNETMKAKHLDFRIQHRFSSIQNGAYDFFGLDGATIRLSLEYGITDRLMTGFGRSTTGKTYDGFLKYQLLEQKHGGLPFGMVLFGSTAISTLEWEDPNRDNYFSSRLSYCIQTIFSSKINEYVSVIVSPGVVHYNLVPDANTPNDVYSVGLGASFKISRSTRFNIEYIPRLNGRDQPLQSNGEPTYYDAIAFGFDIETGGHVFQLHFTNATGLIEQQFIGRNSNPIEMAQLRFGFNISRTFSFDK